MKKHLDSRLMETYKKGKVEANRIDTCSPRRKQPRGSDQFVEIPEIWQLTRVVPDRQSMYVKAG